MEEGVCLELEQDMKTVKGGEMVTILGPSKAKGTEFEGHAFFEASSPRKIGEKYYLVYSSQQSHELCYAVSRYPNKDFHYGGTIVSIGDIGFEGRTEPLNYTGNTHGGMVEVNGQWYIFYHRQTNKQKCCRQGCAEKVTILPDGSIPQVEITSCGLNPTALCGEGTYEARIACNLASKQGTFPYVNTREKDKKQLHPYFTQSGADREENGNQYIANLKDGSFAGFKYFLFDGLKEVSVCVRGQGNGKMEVREQLGGEPICVISVSPTAEWKNFTAPAELNGTHALYFTFRGDGHIDFRSFTLGQ